MKMRLLIAGPLAMLASLFIATSALAGVRLTVDTTADDTATPNTDGQCTLREAVAVSNADDALSEDCPTNGSPSENQIGFAPALGGNPVITLALFGDLEIAGHDVAITGPATVMAADDSHHRVINSNGINLTLNSLTISNGSDTSGSGGGIRAIAGTLHLNNSSVTGNTETKTGPSGSIVAQGGGIFSLGAAVTLTDSNVSNNQAIATAGGTANVLALGGGMEIQSGDVTLQNSVVSGNQALGSSSGDSGSLEGDGGGIRTDGAVTIKHSTISGNLGSAAATGTSTSLQAQGGGLLVHGTGAVDVELSTIANNLMKSTGGATPLTRGGGIADQAMGTDDNFISDTIAGNGLDPGSATTDVQGLNVYANTGTGSKSFSNTIIANPIGSAGTNCDLDVPLADNGPNLEFPGDPGPFVACFDPTHMNVMHVDPQLGALGSHGGATATMVPAATSPVIDQGTAAQQTDATHDQRGLTRPVVFSGIKPFDGTDIGAVEVQKQCAEQTTPTFVCPTPPGPPAPTPSQPAPSPKKKKCKKHKKGKKASVAKKKCKKKHKK